MKTNYVGYVLCVLLLAGCVNAPPPATPKQPMDLTLRSPTGLELRPFLRLNLKFHTGSIMRMAADRDGKILATVSLDKTAKIWSIPDLKPLKTLYVPVGTGNEGKLYSVAVSPDGKTVAVGGWLTSGRNKLYVHLFDVASGTIVRSIGGLEDIPTHLCYSPTGQYLAAVLSNANGVRVWDTSNQYQLTMSDTKYGDSSFYCQFGQSGQLLTSSYDGYLRVYSADNFSLRIKKLAPGGRHPFFAPFSPDEKLVAVGYSDSARIDILSAVLLEHQYSVDNGGSAISGGLGRVAWSHDSFFVFGGGRYKNKKDFYPIRIWRDKGKGTYKEFGQSYDTVMGITVLKDRTFIVSSQDPTLYSVNQKGEIFKRIKPEIVNYNISSNRLGVSENGNEIVYYYRSGRHFYKAYFDAKNFILRGTPPKTADIAFPKTKSGSFVAEKSANPLHVIINGSTVPLGNNDRLHSLSLSHDGRRLVAGNEYSIKVFSSGGIEKLGISTHASAYQVNISKNMKWIVAALSDGTIQWYDAKTGKKMLTLFMSSDGKEWLLYTPENNYTTSPGGSRLISWQKNINGGASPVYMPESEYKAEFNNPDIIKQLFD